MQPLIKLLKNMTKLCQMSEKNLTNYKRMSVSEKIDQLLESSNVENDLSAYLNGLVKASNVTDFEEALQLFFQKTAKPNDATKALNDVTDLIEKIQDQQLAYQFSSNLAKIFNQYTNLIQQVPKFNQIYEKACRSNTRIMEFARFFEKQKPDPNIVKDSDILEYYVKLGNLYVESNSSADNIIKDGSEHYFPLGTEAGLAKRWKAMQAENYIVTSHHIKASSLFRELYLLETDPDAKTNYLKRAIITACYTQPGPHRDFEFSELSQIEEAHLLDIYKMVDAFMGNQIISDELINKFWDFIKEEKMVNKQKFEDNVRKHNMIQISYIYKSISFTRLANLIGTTEEKVKQYLDLMISNNVIRAKIDQPSNTVLYIDNDVRNIDNEILSFANEVDTLVNMIH